jgi:hypothetical protein
MKRWSCVLLCLLAMSGCARFGATAPPAAPAPKPAPQLGSDGLPLLDLNGVPIERVEFKPGVSSVTVEKMGRQAGCQGGMGAGLMTPPGPVEVYRMRCDGGKVFMARCELRQCRTM